MLSLHCFIQGKKWHVVAKNKRTIANTNQAKLFDARLRYIVLSIMKAVMLIRIPIVADTDLQGIGGQLSTCSSSICAHTKWRTHSFQSWIDEHTTPFCIVGMIGYSWNFVKISMWSKVPCACCSTMWPRRKTLAQKTILLIIVMSFLIAFLSLYTLRW